MRRTGEIGVAGDVTGVSTFVLCRFVASPLDSASCLRLLFAGSLLLLVDMDEFSFTLTIKRGLAESGDVGSWEASPLTAGVGSGGDEEGGDRGAGGAETSGPDDEMLPSS